MNEKMEQCQKISKTKKKLIEDSEFAIESKWSIVRSKVLGTDSPKKEKAYALNHFLNNYYFPVLDNPNYWDYKSRRGTSRVCWSYANDNKIRSNTLYKYRIVFSGDKESRLASYSDFHSILASIIIDYPRVENEKEIVTSLRESWMAIRKFGKDKSQTELKIKNCDIKYQRYYKEMLRHILISDKDLPKCINVDSLKKINEDLTYTINKK